MNEGVAAAGAEPQWPCFPDPGRWGVLGRGQVSEEQEHLAGIFLEFPEAVRPWDGDT